MTFEAKKFENLNSKLGCPNLNALKTSKQYSYMTPMAFGVYADVILLYKFNIFSARVSTFPTLVPRLFWSQFHQRVYDVFLS